MTHRPALVLACAFAGGIVAHRLFGAVGLFAVLAVIISVILALVLMRRAPWGLFLAALTFGCGALAAWDSALVPQDHISRQLETLRGRDVEAVCRVVSAPELKTRGLAPRTVFGCDLHEVDGRSARGQVLVNVFSAVHTVYGDRVKMRGKFTLPYDFSMGGRTSYRAWLARQGITAVFHVPKAAPVRILEPAHGLTLESLALSIRLRLQQIFFRYLSPGEAGLMNAMLLGPRGDIPPHVYDVFRRTGTAHIIAISGMNMALTAAGLMFLLGICRAPRIPRAVLAALVLGFYSLMAGNSAPVLRSAVMAVVVILGLTAEREIDAFNNLGLAAFVLFAADPGQISDIGCQLSFVCVAALMLLTPLILEPFRQMGWPARRVLWFFVESAGVTLAAFIGSAGIIAYDFGYLTPVGLLVNLPVIPLMALVSALGALVLGTGIFIPFLAGPCALCLKVVLNASVGVLVMASRTPVMSLTDMPVLMCAAYYMVLGVIIILGRARSPQGSVEVCSAFC